MANKLDVGTSRRLPGTLEQVGGCVIKASRLSYLPMFLLPVLSACSNSAPPAVAPQATTVAAAPMPVTVTPAPIAPGDAHKACSVVTAAEMSAILGNAVVATPHDGTDGASACSYAPLIGAGSRAEIMISWGDGEIALQMVRALKDHDAADDLPYQGIGDDAVYESPAVVVRQGKDLIGVAVFGSPDVPAAVKQIINTAKPKLEVASISMNAATNPANAAMVSSH